MSIWNEKPKLEITEARAIINGIEVKNGDVFLLMKDGEIIERGIIKFCVYDDGEGFYDFWHIGFIIEWDDPEQILPRTLVDAIGEAQDSGMKWKIVSNGRRNQNEKSSNTK